MDRGRSLNPKERSDEAVSAAVRDGLLSGLCTLIPSSAAVWYFVKTSPAFRQKTNYQSRTALVIMPPLFIFGLASEMKMEHMKHEMANEAEHNTNVTEWAEQQQSSTKRRMFNYDRHKGSENEDDDSKKLAELYLKSIENSGVRIIPGSSLGPHHKFANFWQDHPFKMLAALGVPTVFYIFKGRNSQHHLQLQSKIMHTRVFGQFAVIGLLLTLMGFKGYMDANGKFITELEAERRVEDMKIAREDLIWRLERDRQGEKHKENLVKAIQEEEDEKRKKEREKIVTEKNVPVQVAEADEILKD